MVRSLLLTLLLLFSGCERMLFHPDHRVYRTPDDDAFSYSDIYFDSEDGTRLHGWWVRPEGDSKGLMVIVHGNAQNLSAHYRGWIWLVESGYELFIFDYRGYGKSEGQPGLAEAVEDTRAALEFAMERHQGSRFVCGQSLGGVLLSNALASGPDLGHRSVIIDSAYSGLEEMGRHVLSRSYLTWPLQWLAYPLLSDEYDAVDRVTQIKAPLLFVAGSSDSIIPPNNSWQLFDAAMRPKEMWLVEGAGHISAFDGPVMQKALLKYLEDVPVASEYSAMKIYDNIDRP